MKYKMLVSDIDNTLIPNQLSHVSERTKNAMKMARDKGVYITLATGRGFSKAKPVIEELNIENYVIMYNGGMIKKNNDEAPILNLVLPKEYIIEIEKIAKREDSFFGLYTESGILIKNLKDKELEEYFYKYHKVGHINDIEKELNEDVPRILIVSDMDTMEKVRLEVLKTFDPAPYCVYFHGEKSFLEILHWDISKAKGLKFLSEKLGIKPEEIIAIGDNENDVEMIEFAGLGVAVENATENVKAKADYITKSDVEDGVAEVIEKFILNEE